MKRAILQLIGCGLLLTSLQPTLALAQASIPQTQRSSSDILISQNNPNGGQTPERNRGGGINPFGIFRTIIDLQRDRQPAAPKPRDAFEDAFYNGTPAQAVESFEALQRDEFADQLEIDLPKGFIPAESIARQLGIMSRLTGKRTAVLYLANLERSKQVGQMLVLPQLSNREQAQAHPLASTALVPLAQASNESIIRQVAPGVDLKTVLETAKQFRRDVSDPSQQGSRLYQRNAQQLYQWLIAPVMPQLQARGIDTVLFSMDDGLRSLPVAALQNGNQFLIESHSVALIPSFGLMDTSLRSDLTLKPLLAMGISKSHEGLSPLPMVPIEVNTLSTQIWSGAKTTLDEASTLDNLKSLNREQRFGIIHLATHAEFNAGDIDKSFIQFWDDKLKLKKLNKIAKDLKWNQSPVVELLVMSACTTALGSKEAELGFAGSALLAGVKSTVASLWYVSDQGSLALMTGFYDHLKTAPNKSEALREAQLAMLRGQVKIQDGQLVQQGKDAIALPPMVDLQGDVSLQHPYYWSGYTVIGNWN